MVEQIKSLVEGGKATAGPPLGPALGPLGVPINKVIEEINAKTKDFAGIQVPVTVTVDPKTKAFEIEVGTPPVSSLIKRELSLEKGAANAKEEKVADMVIEQVNKIYFKSLKPIYLLSIFSAIVVYMNSEKIIKLFLHEDYYGAISVLKIMAFLPAFSAISQIKFLARFS